MSRGAGVVCAGALLLAAGCSFDSFLVSFAAPGGKQLVAAGSVDQVSATLQAALSDAGIAVLAKRQGQDVRLAGVTRSGKVFTLVLRREKAARGDKTTVTVQWDREADESFWLTVVEVLTAPPAPGSGGLPDADRDAQPPAPAGVRK